MTDTSHADTADTLAPRPEQPALRVDGVEGILTVTINRPDARNAVNNAVADGLWDALERLDTDDHLKVGIITGAGGAFCAGMDLKAFAAEGVPRKLHDVYRRGTAKPLIAAVEGYALGGGFEIALACDMIVAAAGAKFAFPEVSVGLIAAGGGLMRLGRRLPYALAMEMIVTGERLSAERAEHYGLVNKIVEPGQTLAAAQDLARRIVTNAPLAITASKQLVRDAANMSEADFWNHQKSFVRTVLRSQDSKEGSRAFAQKRPPVWTGQ
jgi:enoyl-CoA hydratase/carnithine racemase